MGDDFAGESDLIENSTEPLHREVSGVRSGEATAAGVAEAWKPKSFFGSFLFLLYEQTGNWAWYLLLSAMLRKIEGY
jgi:hypothetical protein